jgi:hypothetical protein
MADFDFDPHHCVQTKKEYNVLKTDMEGMKIKTRLKSTLPLRQWELVFHLQSNTERNALLSHYDGQYGSLTPFNWTSIPEHISAESSIYVRYVSYKEDVIATNCIEVSIEFEEAL